jgi:beta-lactamase superfamily II metal-dependent hydrolase
MLWDCGHADWARPSVFLPRKGVRRIDRFFVTNFDEDHISDLPNLRENINISLLHRNKSITATQLELLKRQSGPISYAMQSMLDMICTYTCGPPILPPEFPRVRYSTFSNPYGCNFNDTNNISLVTFLQCGDVSFVIPGDLEVAGWIELLKNINFQTELANVNVFIASHHGRENGYCSDVFKYCSPSVVIFSDSPMKHATQEMASTYATHASGVTFNGEKRYVLTTRNDGSISWTL